MLSQSVGLVSGDVLQVGIIQSVTVCAVAKETGSPRFTQLWMILTRSFSQATVRQSGV
jgi:hypothetical protein